MHDPPAGKAGATWRVAHGDPTPRVRPGKASQRMPTQPYNLRPP